MDISTLNWLAIILATLAFYATGAIWYSPILFGNIWMEEVSLTQDSLKKVNMVKIFTLTFILSFIMVLNLAFFLNSPDVDAKMGAIYGFMTGFGWVTMAMILTGLYEQRSWRYMAIHSGYMIVGFTLAGVILGAWK